MTILTLITLLIGCSNSYNKIDYTNMDDLFSQLTDDYLDYEEMNNFIFTIKEDNVEDEFHKYLYSLKLNRETGNEFKNGWTIYYGVSNGYFNKEIV